MFSHDEQEEIIDEFLNGIEMKTIIKDKVSMPENCKSNQKSMSLHKLNMPENVVKHIFKYYYYEECEVCKT